MNIHRGLLVGLAAAGSYGIAQEVGGSFTGPLFWMVFTISMLIGYTVVITYKPEPEKTVYDDFGLNNRERFNRRVQAISDIASDNFERSKITGEKGRLLNRKKYIVVEAYEFLKIWDICDYLKNDTFVPDNRY